MAPDIFVADLFCGAGGASNGMVEAAKRLGLHYDLLAVNHWPIAVATHSLNHPGVRHMCEAVERINPREAVPGGRLHLLMAGPECTHHSTARGGRPINDQSRATAWHILKWAQELYIDSILIENVPEFRSWGPLGANGRPLKSKKGQTYRAFIMALESLGYRVQERIICAADYGDPTTRQRLFILARRGRHKLSWPASTHSKLGDRTLFGKTKRWKSAREAVIDWSLEGKSIFDRKIPLAPNTMRRILAGLEKYGGPEIQPFLVVLRQNMDGQSVDGPVPTISAQGTHIGLAEPFLVGAGGPARAGEPRSVDQPLNTVLGRSTKALVDSVILPIDQKGSGENVATPIDAPLTTITTKLRHGIAEPFIIPVNHGEGDLRTTSIEGPLPTLTARANQYLIEPEVTPFVLGQQTGSVARSVDEPVPTIATDGAIQLVQPFMVPMYMEREGQTPRTHSVEDPVPTIPATGGGKFAVVEPFLVDMVGPDKVGDDHRNKPLGEPLGTVTGSPRFGLAEPFLTKFYGTATGAQSVDEPIDTITAKERHALVQPIVNGYKLDIRFRMLQPHELARAMSFPENFQFQGKREDVIKQIGNAWPNSTAKALCLEILKDHAVSKPKKGKKVA